MAATGKREADNARESLAAALGRANARIAELTSKSAQLARYDVEVVRAHMMATISQQRCHFMVGSDGSMECAIYSAESADHTCVGLRWNSWAEDYVGSDGSSYSPVFLAFYFAVFEPGGRPGFFDVLVDKLDDMPHVQGEREPCLLSVLSISLCPSLTLSSIYSVLSLFKNAA